MRAFCTVSAPLDACASPADQLSPGSRFLALRLLGHQQPKTLYFLVDAKSRVREVYTQTCLHFATHGMLDTELFGLAVLIDGEYMFADPESKLSKYGPKSWRSSHTHGLDANGRPLLELHFRVQFYIESPFILKDENSRHNYYLQLKYNTLQREIPREYSEQSMILLAGLALQADLGDVPLTTATRTSAAPSPSPTAITSNVADNKTKTMPGQDINSGGGGERDNSAVTAAATTTSTTTSNTTTTRATTTLPKISKRFSSANGRMMRLSTYVAATSQQAAAKFSPKSAKSNAAPVLPSAPKASTPQATTSSGKSSSADTDYFRIEEYLPGGLHTAWACSALRACHRENRGMSTADAELHYIQQACLLHETINAHTFRMRISKNENGQGNSWFVVYAKGIKIISNGGGGGGGSSNSGAEAAAIDKQQVTFLWPNITKLSFERKKFEIRSGENKITLYATSDEKNKMLLTLCKETHQFSMKIAARLKEVIKREEEESNSLHACYIYSRSLHLPYKNKNDQRISVISSTSSNTTSGIVSDRVHSEDELEIMINTPPAPIAAPSTESLALAHLLDRPSVSRQTSSVGQVSLKDLEEQLAALSVRQVQKQRLGSSSGGESPTELSNTSTGNFSTTSGSMPIAVCQRTTDSSTATDSPNSQHNIGSQCSSTCSTVVVTSTGAEPTMISLESRAQRRNSTSSSLELGFSHTAQNSAVSEAESACVAHDYMASGRDETESVSGVYTLAHGAPPTETSGVYTMHSSEMTGESSEMAESEKSSHYGIFQPAKSEISDDHLRADHPVLDAVHGKKYKLQNKRLKDEEFRLRSDSNISTTSSFRGDGSDPTDNKHSLLSAEELTDLIVGRGTYPNRKTVANTLHSDCDYVTLPLAMEGDSYIQGHKDTAPTEDLVEDMIIDLLPGDPPAPPQRVDSNGLGTPNLSNIQMRSPPPYHAMHEKTGLCGPPIRNSMPERNAGMSSTTPPAVKLPTCVPALPKVKPMEPKLTPATPPAPLPASKPARTINPVTLRRHNPPPYPSSMKPRPTSLISITSNASSSLNQPSQVLSSAGDSMTSIKSEEVPARFITTRPQISILKAHTSLVNDSAKPSYAAPTNCSSGVSSSGGSVCSHQLSSHLSQQSVHNSNYVSGSQASLQLHQHHHHHSNSVSGQASMSAAAVAAHAATAAGVIPSTIGIPIVPYGLHSTHKSMSSLHQQPPPAPPPPYPEMAPQTCVLLPVIKSRQFLPPPPPSLPRQPPPPPPNQLAGVYTSQLARKQMEIYRQQLYSDVDYVIYPIQDPAVSQQEYLDAKQGSILAAMAQSTQTAHHPYLAAYHGGHAGTWDTCKGHAIYRSTPYLPLALSTHSRYASTQNLSDTYVQLPSAAYSPLYSPSMASLCSSYEPPAPLHPAAALAAAVNTSNLFARSRSDDNILNSLDSMPKVKRLPPPVPPPYVNRRLKKPPMPAPNEKPPPIPSKPASTLSNSSAHIRCQLPPRKLPTLSGHSANTPFTTTTSGAQWAGERPRSDCPLSRGNNSILAQLQASMASSRQQQHPSSSGSPSARNGGLLGTPGPAPPNPLDIALLREKSKNLDLPLISALCNDRSLLKQTKVMVNPKHAKNSSTSTNPTSTTTSKISLTSGSSTLTTHVSRSSVQQQQQQQQQQLSSSSANKSMAISSHSNTTLNGTMPTSMTTATSNASVAIGSTTTTTTTTTTINTNSQVTSSKMTDSSLGKQRKTSISHRHPNDKLPPLPMQLAEANNYVMDPAVLKLHKSYNSQT